MDFHHNTARERLENGEYDKNSERTLFTIHCKFISLHLRTDNYTYKIYEKRGNNIAEIYHIDDRAKAVSYMNSIKTKNDIFKKTLDNY